MSDERDRTLVVRLWAEPDTTAVDDVRASMRIVGELDRYSAHGVDRARRITDELVLRLVSEIVADDPTDDVS